MIYSFLVHSWYFLSYSISNVMRQVLCDLISDLEIRSTSMVFELDLYLGTIRMCTKNEKNKFKSSQVRARKPKICTWWPLTSTLVYRSTKCYSLKFARGIYNLFVIWYMHSWYFFHFQTLQNRNPKCALDDLWPLALYVPVRQ
jgi:hypothetical protein